MRVKKNNEVNETIINRLSIRILEGIKSMIRDYDFLYNNEELDLLKRMLSKISSTQSIEVINEIEYQLKGLVFKTWEYEEKQGSSFIHWLKNDMINSENPVISATFGNVEPFCDSVVGIKYSTNIKGFLGACEKDAAVVVESSDKESIYTIKTLDDGRVVNSYNLSTPIITPKQAIDNQNNDYKSKHNEIVLDANYVTPVEIICLDNKFSDLAIEISKKYNIPYNKKDQTHIWKKLDIFKYLELNKSNNKKDFII